MEGGGEERASVRRLRGTIVERRNTEHLSRRIPRADSSGQFSNEAEGVDSHNGNENRSPLSFIQPRRYGSVNESLRRTVTSESGLRFARRRYASTTSSQYKRVSVAERAVATDDAEASESSDDVDSSDDEDEDADASGSTPNDSFTASLSNEENPALPTGVSQATALASTATGLSATPSSVPHNELKGLGSTGDKVGVAIGVIVGTALIVFLVTFFTLRRRYGPTSFWPCIDRRRQEQTEKSWSPSSGSDTKDGPQMTTSEPGWTRVDSFEKPLEKPDLQSQRDTRPPSYLRRAPLTSNPVTPPAIPTHYLKKRAESRYSSGSESSLDKEVQMPAAVARPMNSRLTISSSESSESESRPAGFDAQDPEVEQEEYADAAPRPLKIRKPGVSYFSWSTAPTTPGSATTSNRDTILTDVSEPPRFRSITSWVREQSKRRNHELSKHPSLTFMPPPIPESNPVTLYPPYPPTPPIPRSKTRWDEEQGTDQMSEYPRTPASTVDRSGLGIGVAISKPPRASFLSMTSSNISRNSKQIRHNSSTTISTLTVFRQHPGEEIKIDRGTGVRSASLLGLTQWT